MVSECALNLTEVNSALTEDLVWCENIRTGETGHTSPSCAMNIFVVVRVYMGHKESIYESVFIEIQIKDTDKV